MPGGKDGTDGARAIVAGSSGDKSGGSVLRDKVSPTLNGLGPTLLRTIEPSDLSLLIILYITRFTPTVLFPTQSNPIQSNPIQSNQIKSNQIKSNKPHPAPALRRVAN